MSPKCVVCDGPIVMSPEIMVYPTMNYAHTACHYRDLYERYKGMCDELLRIKETDSKHIAALELELKEIKRAIPCEFPEGEADK